MPLAVCTRSAARVADGALVATEAYAFGEDFGGDYVTPARHFAAVEWHAPCTSSNGMPTQRKRRSSSGEPKPTDEAAKAEQYRRHLDWLLDEALRETFPASDPIAVTPRRRSRNRERP